VNRKVVKIGIISKDDYRNRTIAIAKGEYRPQKGEPKIWFESLNSMSQVLSSDNQKLLGLIIKHNPRSLTELEKLSNRNKSNLSRTLKTLERFGIIDLPKESGKLVPKVRATDFSVRFGLNYSNPINKQPNHATI
jgi:predicted transcriptional regulator